MRAPRGIKKTAWAAYMGAVALGLGLALAGCGGGGTEGTLQAAQKDGQRRDDGTLKTIRICDPSGCYIAWRVVDSDDDGVNDADEIVAGTDPRDANSFPSLKLVVELAGKATLPSFEAGLGQIAVFHTDLQSQLVKAFPEFAGEFGGALAKNFAFPTGPARLSSVLVFGVGEELLGKQGIDGRLGGFTVGPRKAEDGDMPSMGRRVGGIEMRLISGDAGEDDLAPLPHLDHGGEGKTQKFQGGKTTDFPDGCQYTKFNDGSTTVWDNKKGEGTTYPKPEPVNSYVNPDADDGYTGRKLSVPPDTEKRVLRMRNAAGRTVEGWMHEDRSPGDIKDKKPLIMLVDDALPMINAMLVPDLHNEAQPETRPDLPNPTVPAGGSPGNTGGGGAGGGGAGGGAGGGGGVGCDARTGLCN